MDLIVLKLILIAVMILGTLFVGLLPMRVLRYLRHSAANASSSQQHKHVSLVLCLLTCFSGGVFLATCFLHLFPELVENVDDLDKKYNWRVNYPLAELLSCFGFFFLFFIEEVVILAIPSLAHSHSHGNHHPHSEHTPLQTGLNESGCCMTSGFPAPNQPVQEVQVEVAGESSSDEDVEAAGHCQKHCPLTVHQVKKNTGRDTPECAAQNDKRSRSTELLISRRSYGSIPSNLSKHEFFRSYSAGYRVFQPLAVAEPERCETNCETVNEDPPILMKSSPHAHSHGVRSVTLVLALSIHSIIEGVALGVGNNAAETTALFLSLLVHKLIVAFSVGLQLSRTHAHQLGWVFVSMLTLALMSPLGALIGMVLQSATEASFGKDLTITILQGLAVGTFLYVTFFEVLLHERDNEHPNLLKLVVMILGFGLIGLLRLIDSHDHDHSHEESLLGTSTLAGPLVGGLTTVN
ncbi:unnamed protein product [Auanema sp. JU1783]|nr:unnamed protein product [Auanema sp. JU1783]